MNWKEIRKADQDWLDIRFEDFKYYHQTRRVQIDGKHYPMVKLMEQDIRPKKKLIAAKKLKDFEERKPSDFEVIELNSLEDI